MIIKAKTGTVNAVIYGTVAKQGGVYYPFPYPERADVLGMDKEQIYKAICETHGDIGDMKDMIHDIKLTFTADPVPIGEKEMSYDDLYKSFKQALEEIDQQNKVIDLAVNEVCRCMGAKMSDESIKKGMFERCKGITK